MSSALVRRGLEMLNADLTAEGPEGKKKKKKNVMKNSGSKKKSSIASTVGHSRASTKDRRVRSALEEASRGQKKDHTSVNLQYFLSSSRASADHTNKIVRQNSGRCSRSSVAPPARKPKESQSVFTEEEFQQFQKEYFGAVMEKQ